MNRRVATAFTLLAALMGGCVEISQILAPPPPPAEEVDWTVFGTSYDAGDTDTNGADDADTSGVDDVDTNGDAVDDIGTAGPDEPAGDEPADTDTNGPDDVDATGIPPLPEGTVPLTTSSGLQFYDFEQGTGDQPPDLNATVRVAYTGYLPDGTVFDSNEDATFNLSNLIEGFGEGVASMKVGGMRRLIIPPEIGYGASGNAGAGIGGEDTIIFDVTLKEVVTP